MQVTTFFANSQFFNLYLVTLQKFRADEQLKYRKSSRNRAGKCGLG